ncbi:MAG: ATP-dependent DNA helicase RecG, partial [Candidatus Nanopelagicales bacterium]
MVDFDTPLSLVVGGRTAGRLDKAFGLRTVEDALRNYPRRYLRRGQLTGLSDLRLSDEVTVIAEIVRIQTGRLAPKGGRGRPRFKTDVVISDGRERLSLVFFNKAWIESKLSVGGQAMFAGTVGEFRGRRQLVNPDVQQLPPQWDAAASAAAESFTGILPVYRGSASVRNWVVSDSMRTVLAAVDDLDDPLPDSVCRNAGLLSFAEAMRAIHDPADDADIARARQRFKFEEAFVLQTELLRRRAARRARRAVPRTASAAGLQAALDARLPFELTPGQRAVSDEIAADMAEGHPMLRLLQGDVGSGKTVVALRAMLATVDAGAQAALLAPTEVLAQQHFATILDLLGPLAQRGQLAGDANGTSAVLLTGSLGALAKRRALLAAASGDAGLVVGTHALMSEGVQFADLGLVVVDEQHRFGVEQRAALAEQGGDASPHMLVMTATPIPRTVAMTVFGDVDVSTLRERPVGRSPVTTHVVPAVARPAYLERAWERVREEVAAGHKVYIVCPRIT